MTRVHVLPRLLLLTDRRQAPDLLGVLHAAVDAGVRAVLLRERDLPEGERAALGAQVQRLLDPVGGALVWAGPPPVAGALSHLAARDAATATGPHGRSCHDAAELEAAAREGCAWATVSPVRRTASKPGHGPALGADALAALVAGTSVPVWALGGLGPGDAGACLAAGARGVAVMGAVMRADDPAAVVAALLEELA